MIEEFRKAGRHAYLRQRFLDDFFKENPCEDVERLVYNVGTGRTDYLAEMKSLVSRGYIGMEEMKKQLELIRKKRMPKNKEGVFMMEIIHHPYDLGHGRKVKIFINPLLFELCSYLGFSEWLRNHEYFHARDHKHGIMIGDITINSSNSRRLQKKTIMGLLESRANFNECILTEFVTFYSLNASIKFVEWRNLLENTKPENDFETLVIKRQLAVFKRDAEQAGKLRTI